jgi:hypothetical protein
MITLKSGGMSYSKK